MRTVSVSVDIDASVEDVRSELSPESLIEYEQTYEVAQVAETDDGWYLTVVSREQDIEMDLVFEERSNGCAYELVSGGPFKELRTTLVIETDRTADAEAVSDTGHDTGRNRTGYIRVTMTSTYTFGGWFAPLIDWLASTNRQRELERAVFGLTDDVHGVQLAPGDDECNAGMR